ncbi:MAG: YlxR family protein [Peptoniphilaceae bacterium]|nr:YlxR family protein [Peptoniphilaceae bacterium]MDD7382994.1 YlxR family protein [Peptoniphilaceae bacterium]MDY3737745.1 YlxR family protein [Peptoniphilaceae bacterium]
MKQKKIPIRKCVICAENKPKKDLIRIVNNKEEGISVDPTGKKNGRGAYICRSVECLEKAKKTKKLDKIFKTKIDDSVYEEIEAYVEK